MTAMSGAKSRRCLLVSSLFGCLMAAALVLGHGSFVARAAETVGDAVQSVVTPTKIEGGKKALGASKSDATNKLAKVERPLPAPPKPIMLTALESLTQPTLARPAKGDVAVSLDKGEAEILQTGSSAARTSIDAPPVPLEIVVPRPAEAERAVARPQPPGIATMKALRVGFTPGGADLPQSAAPTIGELAILMSKEPGLRLQLLAFATATTENESQSRRLSLDRALAVRGALIDAGVRSTRIDVRALGGQTDEKPTDRVDILVMQRSGG